MTASLDNPSSLSLHPTARFSVLDVHKEQRKSIERQLLRKLPQHIPVIALEELLLHEHRQSTRILQERLHDALSTQGFCLLTTPNHSRPAALIKSLRTSLQQDLFPATDDSNAANLQSSNSIYISERDVPMYRLGYERSDDNIRQMYRVAAGRPDEQPWPTLETRSIWLRALGFMRHVTDMALELLLSRQFEIYQDEDGAASNTSIPAIRSRPYPGSASWIKDKYADSDLHSLTERTQDFSVLYAMHYFGNSLTNDDDDIAVKQHVDPSLLVMEPFLCPDVIGLQVWDRTRNAWLDCDGPDSPMHAFDAAATTSQQQVMLLFVGKGLQAHLPNIKPTLHRVVASHGPRRTVIYEQKYGEFYS